MLYFYTNTYSMLEILYLLGFELEFTIKIARINLVYLNSSFPVAEETFQKKKIGWEEGVTGLWFIFHFIN